MNTLFIRILFVFLSVLFLTIYTTTSVSGGFNLTNLAIGWTTGIVFGLAVLSTEVIFRKFNLRAFIIATLGLFFGYLMGQGILLLFEAALNLSSQQIEIETLSLIKIAIFLLSAYAGMMMTALGADEIYLSIPFFRFQPMNQKKKDLILENSILLDPRLLDLAHSGLVDNQVILPGFVLRDLMNQAESQDENIRYKAKKGLEIVKKLENYPDLKLRKDDTDFHDIKDNCQKLIKLARTLDANILTADLTKVQVSSIEGVKIINIHVLANGLKPITQSGEQIDVKIQRFGKEARQGVGYLEDGTMVVVNGGADFMGQTIRAFVLSVKHTSSGRLVFCNASDPEEKLCHAMDTLEPSPRNYFVSEGQYP